MCTAKTPSVPTVAVGEQLSVYPARNSNINHQSGFRQNNFNIKWIIFAYRGEAEARQVKSAQFRSP